MDKLLCIGMVKPTAKNDHHRWSVYEWRGGILKTFRYKMEAIKWKAEQTHRLTPDTDSRERPAERGLK